MKQLQVPEGAAQALLGAIAAVSEHPEDPRTRHLMRFVGEEIGAAVTERVMAPGPELLATVIPKEAGEAVVQRIVLAAMLVPPLGRCRVFGGGAAGPLWHRVSAIRAVCRRVRVRG